MKKHVQSTSWLFGIIGLSLFHQIMALIFLIQHLYRHSRLTDHDVLLVPDVYACRNDVVNSLFMCTTLAILIGSKSPFCMDDRKRPTPVCKRLSPTQAGLGAYYQFVGDFNAQAVFDQSKTRIYFQLLLKSNVF